MRDECLASPLMARSWRVEDLLKVDRGLERRGCQLAQADVLDDDIDLVGGGVHHERFDAAALVVLGDRGVGQRWLEEQQRVGILPLDRRPDPAEVLHDELRQEVSKFRRLRLVSRRVVRDGLGAANLVDPDDQRLHL